MLMKKSILLSLAAALALSFNAGAQVFDHLSIGVGGGTDGLSFELAAPLGKHVQLRAGYGFALGIYKYDKMSINLSQPGETVASATKCPVNLNFAESDARLLFNIYPGSGVFHFTVGAYLGSSNFIKGTISGLPAEAKTSGMQVAGKTIYPTANNNYEMLFRTGKSGFAVKPYLGLGFGRPIRDDKRVTFSFDLGCMYQGKASVWASGLDASGKKLDVDMSNEKDIANSLNDLTKYIAFWPVLNIHLYVRLF